MPAKRQPKSGKSAPDSQGQVRTCVGCRQPRPRTNLLRIVAVPEGPNTPSRAAVDWSLRAPGRGVHVCPSPKCVARAIKKSAFRRVLGVSLDADVEHFMAEVYDGLAARFRQRLSLARRAGAVGAGHGPAAESMKANRSRILIIATDASASGAKKNELNAKRKSLPVLRCVDGKALGSAIGMDFCALVSVESEPFATELERLARQMHGVHSESATDRNSVLEDRGQQVIKPDVDAGVD